MKIVLFLGAGFSKAWGLPVMKEFFQHAKDSEYLTKEDKDFLRNLQSRAQKGVNMLQVRHNNLEEILSFCLAASNFGTGYPDKSVNEYKKLCLILQKVYRRINLLQWGENEGLLEERKRLFSIDDRNTPLSYELDVITTNYDIMAEFSLIGVGFRCRLPNEWTPVEKSPNNLYAKSGGSVLLCKLHGSLNWYLNSKDKETFNIESCLTFANYINASHEHKHIGLPKISLTKYEPISEPIIIPPTLFKMQTDSRFEAIWRSAGELLQGADKIVFIGFSFPESDTHIRYFLAANLYENVDLRSIDIVDPNAKEICDRLQESTFGIHFKDRLNPIKGKWEEINYSISQ